MKVTAFKIDDPVNVFYLTNKKIFQLTSKRRYNSIQKSSSVVGQMNSIFFPFFRHGASNEQKPLTRMEFFCKRNYFLAKKCKVFWWDENACDFKKRCKLISTDGGYKIKSWKEFEKLNLQRMNKLINITAINAEEAETWSCNLEVWFLVSQQQLACSRRILDWMQLSPWSKGKLTSIHFVFICIFYLI